MNQVIVEVTSLSELNSVVKFKKYQTGKKRSQLRKYKNNVIP